jgi:hypothetical protein
MAGMGDYLCYEVLYVAGIHPQHRPADPSNTQLRRLTGNSLHLVRQSCETGGITNDLERATLLHPQGGTIRSLPLSYLPPGRTALLSLWHRHYQGGSSGKFVGRLP